MFGCRHLPAMGNTDTHLVMRTTTERKRRKQQLIGGKRTSFPCHEHKWPSLPSFKGQTSQQKVPIIMT
jgi:hypothetical protein